MDIKKTALSQIEIQIPLSGFRLLDMQIENQSNVHGKMLLKLELAEEVTVNDVLRLEGSNIKAFLPGHRYLFAGICTDISFEEHNGYKTILAEAGSFSRLMDREQHTQTFQSPGKTLQDIVSEIIGRYNGSFRLQKNPGIGTVIYQQKETDWAFLKRIANEYQQEIYVNTRNDRLDIAVGTSGMKTIQTGGKLQLTGVSKEIGEQRMVMSDRNPDAAGYQFIREGYLCEDLAVIPGDTIGRDTIKANRVINAGGELENHIVTARTAGVTAAYEEAAAAACASTILTGTVLKVTGNNIQVQLDADARDMSGDCVEMPYESAVSNSFYCMPDEGDQVFIYYENNGTIVCLGSKRGGNSQDDYKKPEEKVLTSKDKMIRFTSSAVKITDTRKKHDREDDTEISIILNDEDGITITSGSDVMVESMDSGSLSLIALPGGDEAAKAVNSLKAGKAEYDDSFEKGKNLYAQESGMGEWEKFRKANEEEWSRLCRDFGNFKDDLKSAIGSLAFRNIRDLVSGDFIPDAEKSAGADTEETAVQEEDTRYEAGVITIYGLNSVVFQVNESFLVLDADIFVNAPQFGWLGYTKGEHEPVVEEYQDGWGLALDGLQLVLDICGLIPGVGAFFDLANAAVSLARGDLAGAGMSLLGAIPGLGDAMTVAKVGFKAAKTVKTLSRVQRIHQVAKTLYRGVRLFDQGLGTGRQIYACCTEGDFDISNVNDQRKVLDILKSAVGMFATGKDMHGSVNAYKTGKMTVYKLPDANGNGSRPQNAELPEPDSNHPRQNGNADADIQRPQKRNNDGPETPKQSSDTTSDPINVITGSLLAEYVDISMEDVSGAFDLKRCYESAFDNRGGLLGDKWRFEMESSIYVQGETATVQLPDLHMEKFHRKNGNWENLHTDDRSYILAETEEGFVFRKRGIGTIYEYNKKGQLTCITDNHGNRTKLLYEGDTPEKILLAGGGWISFRYQDGKVCGLEDNIGRKVSYTYQGNYLHTASLPNGGTMRYEYTKEGFISCAYDLNGKWYTRNYYDRKGRVIRQELAGGEEYVAFYDDINKQNTFLTASDGNSIIYQYGKEQLAGKIIYPDQTTIEKRYDAGKNVIYEKDRKGNETFRRFDAQGMLLEERFPDGLVKNYEYDSDNRLTKMYDNAGRETIREYDEAGNMVCSRVRLEKEKFAATTFTYDSRGRILSMTDALGNTERYAYDLPISGPTRYITSAGNIIRYTYDAAGRLMEVEDEMGRKSYGYNNFGQRIIVRDEDGNVTRFCYDNMANLVKKIRPNAYNALNDDGEGTVYEYDVWENLTRVIYPDGGTRSFENDFYGKVIKEYSELGETGYEYDADHNRIRSRYPDGAVLREFFDANGNLTKRILPQQYDAAADDGMGYVYEYDCRNRLTQVMNPQGTVEHRYVYDIAGHLIKEMDAKGYLSAETDGERIGTLYTYNLLGLVTEVRKPMEVTSDRVSYRLTAYRYDSYGNCTEEKRYLDYQTQDSAGGRVNCIHYSYDKANRLVGVHDSTGASVEYGYNCRNQKISEKRKISDGIWQERHYFHSASGRIERIMDSADEKGCGRKYTPTYFTYDKNGNITRIRTASGYEILREYDACDRLTAEIHRDRNGKINNRSEYSYDHGGRLTQQRMQDGYTVSYSHDAMGRLAGQKDSRGAVRYLEYDLNGNLVGSLTPVDGGHNTGLRHAYDSLGRNTETTTPDGSILHYNRYNRFGEKEQEGDCMGGIRFTYDFAGRRILAQTQEGSSQSYEYDAAGNITALRDGNGNRTVYGTDLWGRITRTANADGSTETHAYDYAGNVVETTDGNGNRTSWRYNSLNRPSARTDAAGCEETFLYDMEGRMCEHTDREGRSEKYFYNMYGSPVLHKSGQGGLTESWEYDPMGRLKSATGGGMRYDYAYYQGGLLKEKTAGGRVLVSYEYDSLGRKTAQTDLTGRCTQYRYDRNGMLEDVLENGRVLAHYGYYPDGSVRSVSVGDLLHTGYTYDRDKNTTGMKTVLDGEVLLADNRYGYDGNGNRSWKQGPEGLTRYGYDAVNRLAEVRYPDLPDGGPCYEKLDYDYAGNRIRRMTQSLTEEYRHDSCNRLLQLQTHYRDAAREDETIRYSYDRQGNLLSDEKGWYRYDAFNRMTGFAGADGSLQTNRYDAEGLRHEMEENGRLVRFLYSGKEIVAETGQDGSVIRYIRGIGLVSSDSEKARTYYHYVTDENGSVTHVVSGAPKTAESGEKAADRAAAEITAAAKDKKQGRILNRYTYDAFGNTVVCEEQVHNRFRYNGEQYDTITGQYCLRARYYNPVIGRFTQEDTYYGDGLNLYRYCENNPVRYADPGGHCATDRNAYKRYTDVGADPETAKLAGQLYPGLSSKQHLVDKYRARGYSAADALELANREIIHGKGKAEAYAESHMHRSLPDTTRSYDADADFRVQQRLYKMQGAGNKGGTDVIKNNLVNKVKDIRAKMPNTNLAKRGNMAVADVDVPGIKDNFVAHSKINAELDKGADVADFSYLKPENERIFTSYVDDQYPRYHDTEAKILEDIASQITDPNVSGTINLYSELPCCQSCSNIILEFRRMFPNIELNIFVE